MSADTKEMIYEDTVAVIGAIIRGNADEAPKAIREAKASMEFRLEEIGLQTIAGDVWNRVEEACELNK